MKLFSVYDRKAQEFGLLFEAKNEDVAIRQFKNMLANDRLYPPEDYNLYSFGEFNREKGDFTLNKRINGECRVVIYTGESFLDSRGLEKKVEVLR